MSHLFLLFDVPADPLGVASWGILVLVLVIVFVLAVGFAGGMVVLLIWLKRRKTKEGELANQDRPVLKSEI